VLVLVIEFHQIEHDYEHEHEHDKRLLPFRLSLLS
jgi:hypothetical protein